MKATFDIIDALTSSSDIETTVENLSLKFVNINVSGEPNAVLIEDEQSWYIDLRHGLGFAGYPKSSFTIEEAIEDQINM